MSQTTVKELEIQGCRTFVCPNINLIEEKGKELLLKDSTIKRAKDMAIGYFKKTYSRPHYSSAKHLLPAFIYVASILEGDRRFQKEIAEVFGTTNVTITKWYRDIVETMGLTIVCNDTVADKKDRDITRERAKALKNYGTIVHPDFDMIDEGGKVLRSDPFVIKRAKDIAVRYFNKTWSKSRYIPATKTVLPALLYLASILEKDRRTQMDIAIKFNISESNVSIWYKDITDTLGMKIIYGDDKKVLKVLEEQGDL
jgi:transcription initiation factor TFIIIB Brf1 subunit/transcription initiation factor TFIIB